MIIETCESTNDVLKELGRHGAAHGAWVSARMQTGGRGRQGRRWESHSGNLFISMLLRDLPREVLTWIPAAAAVGLCQALENLWPQVDFQIKWPNDIRVGGRKLAGLLCESFKGSDFIVVGAGVNCLSAPVEMTAATSLSDLLKKTIGPDDLRPVVVSCWAVAFNLLARGVDEVRSRYEQRAEFRAGSRITWDGQTGWVVGMGSYGDLKVKRTSGEILSLFAEDVHLSPGS